MPATPKPTPKPTKAPNVDPTPTPTDDGSLLADLGGWLLHHPIAIPILLIAAWAGTLYGWSKLRQYYLQKGKPVPPLGNVLRRIWRFTFKEDKRPVLGNIKPLAAKTAWLTGTRLYLALLALIPITMVTGIFPWPLAIAAFVLTLTARARPIFRARWGVQMQMFAVTAAECRYPRGAELNPWGYVNIQEWRNLTQPGTTIITYPPAYQSEDRNAREKFERNFNGTVSEENTWNYTWESTKNRVVCKPTDFLPTMANYPGPGPKWNEFVLGTTGEGQAVWDVATFPHALVCGPTGSGKSVLQRMILFHALAHSDTWKIVGVDPKMVEMGWLKKYDNVLKIALTLEEGVEVVQSVRDEMMRRYDEMSELGFNHFQNLPQPPPALLCMIDETFNFLALEGIKSEEGKERDAMHAQASTLLGEIARLGRAAGIHLVLATQRPDAKVLAGELKNNLDCRIAAGRMDTTPSLMVLDSEHATRLPKIKGRGVIRLGGEIETFQGYFAPQEWYDEWKVAQEAGPVGPGGPGEGAGEPGPQGSGSRRGGRFSLSGLAAKAASKADRRRAASDGGDAGRVPSGARWDDPLPGEDVDLGGIADDLPDEFGDLPPGLAGDEFGEGDWDDLDPAAESERGDHVPTSDVAIDEFEPDPVPAAPVEVAPPVAVPALEVPAPTPVPAPLPLPVQPAPGGPSGVGLAPGVPSGPSQQGQGVAPARPQPQPQPAQQPSPAQAPRPVTRPTVPAQSPSGPQFAPVGVNPLLNRPGAARPGPPAVRPAPVPVQPGQVPGVPAARGPVAPAGQPVQAPGAPAARVPVVPAGASVPGRPPVVPVPVDSGEVEAAPPVAPQLPVQRPGGLPVQRPGGVPARPPAADE